MPMRLKGTVHFNNENSIDMNTTKHTYTEPQTIVNEVVMEGFICGSPVKAMMFAPEVDEINNQYCFDTVVE